MKAPMKVPAKTQAKSISSTQWPALRAVAFALACAAGLSVMASTSARAADEQGTSGDTEAQSRKIEPPRVRTREEYGQIVTEYERRGGVYMMTVKPRVGPKQYWNDPDGDGQFQRSTSDNIDESLNLPKWRLGGW